MAQHGRFNPGFSDTSELWRREIRAFAASALDDDDECVISGAMSQERKELHVYVNKLHARCDHWSRNGPEGEREFVVTPARCVDDVDLSPVERRLCRLIRRAPALCASCASIARSSWPRSTCPRTRAAIRAACE